MQSIIKQFFRFSVVGVLSFFIDYGLLFLLTDRFGLHYLLSATLSFGAATGFNYIYSMKFVFERREDMGQARQFAVFLLLSLCGLGLNFMLMQWSVEQLNFHYMIAKMNAAVIVSGWNFITRKVFLEDRSLKKEIIQA